MTFKEAKCPSCGGSLQIPEDKTTVKCMYCGNEILVREAIQLAAGRVKEETQATTVSAKGSAITMIVSGGLLLLIGIPVASKSGLCGIVFITPAIILIISGLISLTSNKVILGLQGVCPYCASSIQLPANVPGANCPACHKRIVIRDMKFISVDTPVGVVRKKESG